MTAEWIVERAGIGIGSFYRYFPNKKAAIGALIGEAQAKRRRAIEDAVCQSVDLDMEAAVKLLSAAPLKPPLQSPSPVLAAYCVALTQWFSSLRSEPHPVVS